MLFLSTKYQIYVDICSILSSHFLRQINAMLCVANNPMYVYVPHPPIHGDMNPSRQSRMLAFHNGKHSKTVDLINRKHG